MISFNTKIRLILKASISIGCLLVAVLCHAKTKPFIELAHDTIFIEPYDSIIPPVTAYDSVGGAVTVYHYGKVDTSRLGTYSAFCYCRDKSGNTSDTLKFTVVVWDHLPPSLSLIGGDRVNVKVGDSFIDPGYIVIDNYDGRPVVLIGGSFKNTKTAGLFTITYQAKDFSGNLSKVLTRYITISAAPAGINDPSYNTLPLKIWPNPAGNYANVQAETSTPQQLDLFLYDCHGKQVAPVAKGIYSGDALQIDLKNLPDGIYLIHGVLGNSIITEKIIVNHL